MTPRDIISLALKKCGVLASGTPVSGEDYNDAFLELQLMLSDWTQKQNLVYVTQTLSYVSNGSPAYTIGPNQAFSISQRPARVLASYCRQLVQAEPNSQAFSSDFNSSFQVTIATGTATGSPNPDFPLEVLTSRIDYDAITTKGITTLPSYVYYEPQWPVGVLYFWPIPLTSLYELFVTVLVPLTILTQQNQAVDFPPEYLNAILYNLAQRLAISYSVPPDPRLMFLAKDSLATLRKANTRIARLKMPQSLVRPGIYNPYSDQVR